MNRASAFLSVGDERDVLDIAHGEQSAGEREVGEERTVWARIAEYESPSDLIELHSRQ